MDDQRPAEEHPAEERLAEERLAEERLAEERLAELLEQQAARITIHLDLDLDGVLRANLEPETTLKSRAASRRATRHRWLAASAAAVVLLVLFWAFFAGGPGVTEPIAVGEEFPVDEAPHDFDAGSSDELAGALALAIGNPNPKPGVELIIWFSPTADSQSIEDVSDWLRQHPQVDRYSYVNQEAAYQEFREYYANQPEVIELVKPEQLPTSFQVATTEPELLAPLAEAFPGVASTATADR